MTTFLSAFCPSCRHSYEPSLIVVQYFHAFHHFFIPFVLIPLQVHASTLNSSSVAIASHDASSVSLPKEDADTYFRFSSTHSPLFCFARIAPVPHVCAAPLAVTCSCLSRISGLVCWCMALKTLPLRNCKHFRLVQVRYLFLVCGRVHNRRMLLSSPVSFCKWMYTNQHHHDDQYAQIKTLQVYTRSYLNQSDQGDQICGFISNKCDIDRLICL